MSKSRSNPDYQYISLSQFVNDFIISQGDDSYLSSDNPVQVLLQARKGIQELNFGTLKEVKAFELQMYSNGLIYLPGDFVGLVRLSYLDEEGNARVLVKDERTTLGSSYLQDHEYNFLLDDKEDYLEADRTDSTRPKVKNINISSCCKDSDLLVIGDYIHDRENGTIAFLKEQPVRIFIVEYISDGLFEGNEKVHKYAEEALYNYVYWKMLMPKRHVPKYEKDQARSEYFNSKRIAEERLNPITWEEIRSIYNS